ncbi:MAG: PEP-CTERM sorting domain-containing protein [Rubrivivax sp.]|nr:PEP-CTERM sorting domain-containing protein [Rubrivivax sp.]
MTTTPLPTPLHSNDPRRLCAGLLLGAAMLAPLASHASAILFIDDDRGQSGSTTWLSTLATLGHTVTYEAISASGQPTSNLGLFDAVIWSNGDAAYDNLTASNVTLLTSYLNGGGRLLYGGGHSVFSETQAQAFIQGYLGLGSYGSDMPTFMNCANTATATGALGSVTLNCMSTGAYKDMMSGFNAVLPTASDLLVLNAQNIMFHGGAQGTAIASINVAGNYRAATWGFDLNHVAAGQRASVLASTLSALQVTTQSVPEPGTLALGAVALFGLAATRRRQKV